MDSREQLIGHKHLLPLLQPGSVVSSSSGASLVKQKEVGISGAAANLGLSPSSHPSPHSTKCGGRSLFHIWCWDLQIWFKLTATQKNALHVLNLFFSGRFSVVFIFYFLVWISLTSSPPPWAAEVFLIHAQIQKTRGFQSMSSNLCHRLFWPADTYLLLRASSLMCSCLIFRPNITPLPPLLH